MAKKQKQKNTHIYLKSQILLFENRTLLFICKYIHAPNFIFLFLRKCFYLTWIVNNDNLKRIRKNPVVQGLFM